MVKLESEKSHNIKDWLVRHWREAVVAISLLGLVTGGATFLEKSKQEFKQKFSHKPEVGLNFNNGVLTLGFTTDSSKMEKWGAGPYQCGRTEILVQEMDSGRHPTRQVEWAAITFGLGPRCKIWDWYKGPKNYNVLPPLKK